MSQSITFYPGPSKLYPQVEQFLVDAFQSGILSQNHRSSAFMALLEKCIYLTKQKLNIPQEYQVYFVSSATECWEIAAQSLLFDRSIFFYNGDFGKKWFQNSLKIGDGEIIGRPFGIQEPITNQLLDFGFDTLCMVHNETSNGTAIEPVSMQLMRDYYDDAIICVDATSSMAGVELDWKLADYWFASVQKCFGLPAGMAMIIASPRCIERVNEKGDDGHYNSLGLIDANFSKFQTHHTPNILDIYLLTRLMEVLPHIHEIDKKINNRYKDFSKFIATQEKFKFLIENPELRSKTVFTLTGEEETIKQFKQKALENGIIIGNGYGNWKNSTFRIANFPAITDIELEKLKTLWT